MFTPSRLTLARQRLGWTRTKLSQESGVSLRSLTSFENGQGSEPSKSKLAQLADSLGVPISFFYRAEVDLVPTRAASFRKLSKTSALKRDAALSTASMAVEFFEAIEAKFNLPVAEIPTLEKFSPGHAAEFLRHQWVLGDRPISNMVHLLESKGVRVAGLPHELAEIDAFCFYRDGTPYVFVNGAKSGERQRFDLAHELGHLVLHADRDAAHEDSREREAEANQFAANFLMPKSAVLGQRMARADLERILAARSYWRVSAMAMTHRLHELGLLSDWQYRSTCMTLSERGYRSSEPGGITPETSQLLRKVLYGENRYSLRDARVDLDISAAELSRYFMGIVPLVA